ncbi:MAG: hypothetical protein GX309_13105 [Clostridiales bacterium]|nr:hypothetical protein [Clostridiales bacterium]
MTSVERIQLGFICNQVEIQSRRPWKDVIRESVEKIKGYRADQSNSNQINNYNSILAPNEDIDNGEIFDIKSGKTIRDLF